MHPSKIAITRTFKTFERIFASQSLSKILLASRYYEDFHGFEKFPGALWCIYLAYFDLTPSSSISNFSSFSQALPLKSNYCTNIKSGTQASQWIMQNVIRVASAETWEYMVRIKPWRALIAVLAFFSKSQILISNFCLGLAWMCSPMRCSVSIPSGPPAC